MPDNIIGAVGKEKDKPQEKEPIEVNLNFGVFFDGTNNNKVQSMIALDKRRSAFFKKYKTELTKLHEGIKNINDLTRVELEEAKIGTIDELDNVFGFSDRIDLSIEKNIASDNSTEYRYASSAEKYDGHDKKGIKGAITKFFFDDATREKLNRTAGNNKGKSVIFNRLSSISTSQGSGYTNIAILNSLYETSETRKDDESTKPLDLYFSIYIEGSGANEQINIVKQLINLPGSIIGLGFGVDSNGVVQKCRKAIQRVKNIYNSYEVREDIMLINCFFDVFGFSRGATTARCFTYILNPKKTDGYVDEKIGKRICGNDSFLLGKGTNKLGAKNVRTLGLYDTVASIGILREGTAYILGDKVLKMSEKKEFSEADSIFHDTNVDDFGLHSTDQADRVLQICALDEFRKNFALVDIESSLKSGNGCEVYIPGCHTDIGGGASMGLDAFKIINCDEIATRGDIIHTLWIRIKGICELYKGLNGLIVAVTETVASASNFASLPVAYKTIQTVIPSLNTAAKGWFSVFTGYESPATYRAKKSLPQPANANISSPKAFSLISDFNNSTKQLIEGMEKTKTELGDGIEKAKQIWKENLVTKAISVYDLYKSGEAVVNSLLSCKQAIESLINDFKLARTRTVGEDVKYLIQAEIAKWQKQKELLDETIEIFKLVFTIEPEKLKIPVEQRRICFYTGIPFDKTMATDKSKHSLIKPLTISTLIELGWIDSTVIKENDGTFMTERPSDETYELARNEGKSILVENTKVAHFFSRENIGICKYARPGYTLISLRAMYEWANTSKLFKPFPVFAYDIPNDLKNFYEQVKMATQANGQHVCTPRHSIFDYRYIRQKYLHLSFNQQILAIADNGLVNGPSCMQVESGLSEKERKELIASKTVASETESFNIDNVITRRIYPGVRKSAAAGGNYYVETPKEHMWYLG